VILPLVRLDNVVIQDATPLDQLPLDRAVAALLPYRATPVCKAVTLANKSMQMLARGLPLLISAMPDFIRQPFVFRLDGPGGFEPALQACDSGFRAVQSAIVDYLTANAPASRLEQLDVSARLD